MNGDPSTLTVDLSSVNWIIHLPFFGVTLYILIYI